MLSATTTTSVTQEPKVFALAGNHTRLLVRDLRARELRTGLPTALAPPRKLERVARRVYVAENVADAALLGNRDGATANVAGSIFVSPTERATT